MIAAFVLGGPLAGAIVAVVGTTDSREVRGSVPWYGTLFNHSVAVVGSVTGGVTFLALQQFVPANPILAGIAEFVALLAASVVFFVVGWTLAVVVVSARTEAPVRAVVAQDLGGTAAHFVGLAPLAWLMALVFQLPNGVGWWATPLFVVPLYSMRVASARYVETRELFEQTISALSKAVDARDRYTRNHSSRVSHIAEEMCRVMRLPESEIERIKWAGLLHDVGKIGIRDHILLKEGPLDREERTLMNMHPEIGAKIVEPATQLAREAPLIRAHHEWWNGSGYPDRIEALEIPLGARILTIADAYEAMTSSRPYRKTPLTHEQAVDQLEKFSGIQFDPNVVPILVHLDRDILDRPADPIEDAPTTLQDHEPAAETVPAEPVIPKLAADDVP
ncbi:MAG: HD-GYP domain-containing protein [Chloroflexi bacterium]|nr:HD-GYP domain-containing protein [Chloroflexota bacterium]